MSYVCTSVFERSTGSAGSREMSYIDGIISLQFSFFSRQLLGYTRNVVASISLSLKKHYMNLQ